MKTFNHKFYDTFRLRAISNASGANIHKVNGYLGVVLNGTQNALYYENKDMMDSYKLSYQTVVKTLSKLATEFKVVASFEDFIGKEDE